MTANGLTTMFLGEKKNRTSKAALLNLSFSRAACLPFAIILLCGRVETNSINPVSQGKVTGQKPCIHAGLSRFDGYSLSLKLRTDCGFTQSICAAWHIHHIDTEYHICRPSARTKNGARKHPCAGEKIIRNGQRARQRRRGSCGNQTSARRAPFPVRREAHRGRRP